MRRARPRPRPFFAALNKAHPTFSRFFYQPIVRGSQSARLRKEKTKHQRRQLHQHERDDAAVDVAGGDFRWSDAAQEEQRPAEGRGEERGLQVHADQGREPDHVHFCGDENRQKQRHCDVGNFNPLDEESEDEDNEHQKPDVGIDAAWQEFEEVLHQSFTLQAAEGKREGLRTHQDEHHHGGDAGGRVGGFAQHRPRHAAADGGYHDSA